MSSYSNSPLTLERLKSASGLGDGMTRLAKRQHREERAGSSLGIKRRKDPGAITEDYRLPKNHAPPSPSSSNTILLSGPHRLQAEYRYQALQESSEIRLLKISTNGCQSRTPTKRSSAYACEIIHTTLAEAPSFQCLSYVWGPDTKDHKLELENGFFVTLNKNLADALPYIYPRCSTGYLWVDQICIHQQSTEERNHQVKVMGDIYSSAKETLIWLGKPAWLGKEWTQQDLQLLDDSITLAEDLIRRRVSVPLLTSSLDDYWAREATCHTIVGRMLANRWFQRAWVFQELVLSPNPNFVFGELIISSNTMYWLAKTVGNFRFPFDSVDSALVEAATRTLPVMLNAWIQLRSMASEPLGVGITMFLEVLSSQSPHSHMRDPRDCVYAFLGLSRGTGIILEPNYTFTLVEVLTTTAVAIIQGMGNLDILYHVVRAGSNRPGLPSWAPDFTRYKGYTPLDEPPIFTRNPYLRAELLTRFSDDHKKLWVRGAIFGTVSTIHDIEGDFLRKFEFTPHSKVMYVLYGPYTAKTGDYVCILEGLYHSAILRSEAPGMYSVVGTLREEFVGGFKKYDSDGDYIGWDHDWGQLTKMDLALI